MGSQTEHPRVLLLDVLMEVFEGGYWPLLMLVTLVRAGLMPGGRPLQLFPAALQPLPGPTGMLWLQKQE